MKTFDYAQTIEGLLTPEIGAGRTTAYAKTQH
jgi:hypothetical protein